MCQRKNLMKILKILREKMKKIEKKLCNAAKAILGVNL